jgi:lysophospholipase L1-like esterase
MTRPTLARALVLALAALGARGARADDFALKPHDVVVFYGDSITDQRLYTTFVETYVVTRFPELDVRFVHSGWGGDRVTGGGGGGIDARIDRDVLPYKPTVVTVMLGMNDAGVRPFDAALFKTFEDGYRHLVERIQTGAPGVRLTLLEPSPFDDVTRPPKFEGGYNEVLKRYGTFVRELAHEKGTSVADLNSSVVAFLNEAKGRDAKLAEKIIPDRVHPGPAGHLVMAAALLEAWHAPSLVSSVEIDAQKRTVVRQENAQVTDCAPESKPLSWTSLESALPFAWEPNDPVLDLAGKCTPVVAALDQEVLKVTGLTARSYVLSIDGGKIDRLPRERLAEGVNLAALATPMRGQALEVHALTLEHDNLHFVRWRQLQVPLAKSGLANLPRVLETLDALEAEVVEKQRARAKPVPHRFELVAEPE